MFVLNAAHCRVLKLAFLWMVALTCFHLAASGMWIKWNTVLSQFLHLKNSYCSANQMLKSTRVLLLPSCLLIWTFLLYWLWVDCNIHLIIPTQCHWMSMQKAEVICSFWRLKFEKTKWLLQWMSMLCWMLIFLCGCWQSQKNLQVEKNVWKNLPRFEIPCPLKALSGAFYGWRLRLWQFYIQGRNFGGLL